MGGNKSTGCRPSWYTTHHHWTFFYIWLQKFPTLVMYSENESCLQVIWKASGNHYGGIVTSPDAPNYEFITPPFSLYGAKMWPLSKTITSMFIALCPTSSGLLRGCTGLILYPLRNSVRESSISLTYHLQNWWPYICWKDIIHQGLQHILVLEDIPTLCKDHDVWRDKVVLVGSRSSWHEI